MDDDDNEEEKAAVPAVALNAEFVLEPLPLLFFCAAMLAAKLARFVPTAALLLPAPVLASAP